MAEREALQKRYAYHEMSNKVEMAKRSSRRPRDGDPTGEVESLRGRNDIGRMGDRVLQTEGTSSSSNNKEKSRPSELAAKMERAERKRHKREQKPKSESMLGASGGQTILDLGSLSGYQPSTPSSRSSYEHLLVR